MTIETTIENLLLDLEKSENIYSFFDKVKEFSEKEENKDISHTKLISEIVSFFKNFIFLVDSSLINQDMIISYFQENKKSFDSDDLDSDIYKLRHYRNLDISELKNKLPKNVLTRELYLKVKPFIFNKENLEYNVIKLFLNHLSPADATYIIDYLFDKNPDLKYSMIIKILESKNLLNKEQIIKCIDKGILKFKNLNAISKSITYKDIIKSNIYSFKHLSIEQKLEIEKNIDFKKHTMLTEHMLNKSLLSQNDWLEIFKKNNKTLRFIPSYLLSNHNIFSDELFLDLLSKEVNSVNQVITIINSISPERINLNFCLKIKEKGLKEVNHPVIQEYLVSQGFFKFK